MGKLHVSVFLAMILLGLVFPICLPGSPGLLSRHALAIQKVPPREACR